MKKSQNMQKNSIQKNSRTNSKNTSQKPTILIDLRPIQSGKLNGVTISAKNWITELLKQTQENSRIILWSNSIKPPKIPKVWLKHPHVQHIHTKIPNKILNICFSLFNYPKIDKLLKIAPESYFCPDLRPFTLNKNIKSFIYIHDIAYKKFPQFLSLKSKLWYKLINPLKIYKKATAVLTNSHFSKKEIQSAYGSKNIHIIYPALPTGWSKIQSIQNILRKPYFLSIATLQPRKNLKNLITAFKIFNKENRYNLKIIGTPDKTFKKEKLKTDKNIKFLGKVTENHKKNLIKNSQGLIYIPFYEGFGLPILEALTLNTAVLATPLKPFKEIYDNRITYCPPTNPQKIAEQIQKIQPKSPPKIKLKNEVKKLAKLLRPH